VVAVGALVMVAPVYLLFVHASHTRAEIFTMPPPVLPGGALRMNWAIALRQFAFADNLASSVYVAILQTAATLLVCSMAGHAFATFTFPFKRPLFAVVLSAMLVSPVLYALPAVIGMLQLDWLDRPFTVWLPGAASALGVLFLRRYIASMVPRQLIEAARCDGCSEWRIYWSVVLPLIRPALLVLGTVAFAGAWNSFSGPFFMLRTESRYTLPLALRSMQNEGNTPWGAMMLVATLMLLPLLLLFAFTFRRLVDAVAVAARRTPT
jgi:multiple sugar transport system permease protein